MTRAHSTAGASRQAARPHARPPATLLGVVLLVLLALMGCASTGSTSAGSSAATLTASSAAGSGAVVTLAPVSATTSLPTVRVSQLPAQARDTLALIAAGGPYPYPKDGVTFNNRERVLPPAPQGFYAEYTVVTPGSADRGARRIVTGDDGSRFYTSDHYQSFREVVSG